MWKEFKEFINNGNVFETAVGLIMALAFKPIVDSVVDIITNIIAGILKLPDFSSLVITLHKASAADLAAQFAHFQKDSVENAKVIREKGMAHFAATYGHGATRVQLQNKDPRGYAHFVKMLSEHSPLGHSLKKRFVAPSVPVTRNSCPCRWIGWLVIVRLPIRMRTLSFNRTFNESMPGKIRLFQLHRLKSSIVMILGV